MKQFSICIPVQTPPLIFAGKMLVQHGAALTALPSDAEYLLYPVPTPPETLSDYTNGKVIIGGNLDFLRPDIRRIDLMQDACYTAANAAITAEAALGMILSGLECQTAGMPVLVLGWGRIGKCLCQLLRALHADISICARKEEDRAMAQALHYRPIAPQELPAKLHTFRCVINTAPAAILPESAAGNFRPDCMRLDLASVRSIPGARVLHAKGLPGKFKPEASGSLIARSVLRHLEDLE